MKNIDGSSSTAHLNPSQLKLLERIQTDSSIIPDPQEASTMATQDLVIVAEDSPLQDLQVGGLVNEILNLILRLEFQRRRSESMLMTERLVQNKLKSDIEGLALRKARELPARVQAEHDACVTDITELNWHISFNQKTERKLTRRCQIAEKMYHEMKERIETIKETTPQIEEKCRYESELRERIGKAQRDIDELLAKTNVRLQDTQDKLEEARLRADKEREAYQADLNATRWELGKAKWVF